MAKPRRYGNLASAFSAAQKIANRTRRPARINVEKSANAKAEAVARKVYNTRLAALTRQGTDRKTALEMADADAQEAYYRVLDRP